MSATIIDKANRGTSTLDDLDPAEAWEESTRLFDDERVATGAVCLSTRGAVGCREAHAHVLWIGNENGGSGRLRGASHAFSAMPVSLVESADASHSATTPGELLAAAHAASFVATLADVLARRGAHARELDADATCEIEDDTHERLVTAAHLRVRGRGTDLDAESFCECCERALACCPISRTLSSNVQITLDARLAPDLSEAPPAARFVDTAVTSV
jgi:OsmC subfamily peroxiredoxin